MTVNGRRRIVVTGAAGQLGSTVVRRLSNEADVHAFTRAQLDIADDRAVSEVIGGLRPGAVINCAAYNDVDGAEDAAPAALAANSLGVLALARASAAAGATLVHYSTDFVFDGDAQLPYSETDRPRPLGAYGASKLLGEYFALEAPAAYVLRVESLFGGQPAKSSIDKILNGIRTGAAVKAFSDRTVSPSYVDDVADATERMLAARAPFGLYHCVNSGRATWLEIAKEIERLLETKAEIVAVSVDDVKLRARRPRFCALSNAKLTSAGIAMRPWQDALSRYITSTSS